MKAQEHNKHAQSRTKENISQERTEKLLKKKNKYENKMNKASELAEFQKLEKVSKAQGHNQKVQ